MQTDFGILQLSTSAPPEAALTWSEQPVHGVLIVLSVAAILLWLPDIIRLMPLLLECVSRVRPNLMLEHSLHQARTRNLAAVLVLVPFCLMADRYGLYRPGFIENLAPGWHVPGLVGIAAAWILLRRSVAQTVLALWPLRIESDERSALHRNLYNSFVVLVALQFFSIITARFIFGCEDASIRTILLVETALMWFVSLLRSGQILRANCSAFSTILYLCGLELIPAAALVASEVVL